MSTKKLQIIGSMSVQSDWNQNDTTAVDYIKNRTHWEEEEVTYSFEHTFTWDEEEWEYPAVENNGFQLVDGVIYTVTIDEITLPCKAKENNLYFLPSNPEASLRYPTDEETAYGVVQYGDYQLGLSDGTLWIWGFGYADNHFSPQQPLDSVNVSITGTAGGIHKLDNRFLDIGTISDDRLAEICGFATIIISFTIDGDEYQAESGMTWYEWCNSDYNNDDNAYYWYSSDNDDYVGQADSYVIYDGDRVLGGDLIIADRGYGAEFDNYIE